MKGGSKHRETRNARGREAFEHEVRDFEKTFQSIKIDVLIALFIEQFSASKIINIVHHTIELSSGVQNTLAGS